MLEPKRFISAQMIHFEFVIFSLLQCPT